MNYLQKHLKLLWRFVVISFVKDVEYKISWYFNIFNQLINLFIWIIFWQIIINNTAEFKGWTFPMLALLTGFFFITEAIWIVFWRNWNFADDIIQGTLTQYLVRPINSYFWVICRYLTVSRVTDFIIALALIVGTYWYYGLDFSLIKFSIAMTVCILGAFLSLNTFAFINVASFWIGRIGSLRMFISSLNVSEKMPYDIFPGALKLFFTLIIPVIFRATYPALIATNYPIRLSLLILFIEMLLLILFWSLFALAWKQGVKRFESHGG